MNAAPALDRETLQVRPLTLLTLLRALRNSVAQL